MKQGKLQRANPQYYAQNAIKYTIRPCLSSLFSRIVRVNARLGGVNHVAGDTQRPSTAFTQLLGSPTMIMGERRRKQVLHNADVMSRRGRDPQLSWFSSAVDCSFDILI